MNARVIPIRDDTDFWNDLVLEACRRSWNMPDLTLEELRAKQLAQPIKHRESDEQFDRRRDVDERGLVERDAYNEEHPRQSQGGREY